MNLGIRIEFSFLEQSELHQKVIETNDLHWWQVTAWPHAVLCPGLASCVLCFVVLCIVGMHLSPELSSCIT